MSKARFGTALRATNNIARAIDYLNEAQRIIDMLGRPDIGARLQDVIESLQGLEPA